MAQKPVIDEEKLRKVFLPLNKPFKCAKPDCSADAVVTFLQIPLCEKHFEIVSTLRWWMTREV